MNQKELTKTFIMISECKKTFDPYEFYLKNSALYGLKTRLH